MRKGMFKAIPDYRGWKIQKVHGGPAPWYDAEKTGTSVHYGSWNLERLRAMIDKGTPLIDETRERAVANYKDEADRGISHSH